MVAELGSGPAGPPERPAAQDQSATDPRADRQQDDVVGALGRAPGQLREGGCVAVVVHRHRQSGQRGNPLLQRHLDQRQVIGVEAEAAIQIDDARNAQPDRGDVGAGLDRDPELGIEQLEERIPIQPGRRRNPPVDRLPARIDDADEHLGAAEVDADGFGRDRRLGAGGRHEAGNGEGMRQYYRVMAPGDPERPDRPELQRLPSRLERPGTRRRAEPKQPDQQKGAGDAGRSKPPSEGPGYSVYKARRGFKRTGTDGTSLRDRLSRKGGSGRSKPGAPGEKPTWRKVARWVRSRPASGS